MPTYEYRCGACGHEMETFQSIKAKPLKKCPVCKENRLERLISGGGAVIFKGSGFYQTDYRSEGYKKAAEAEKKSGEPKSETKPDKSAGSEKGSSKPSGEGSKPASTAESKPKKAAGAGSK